MSSPNYLNANAQAMAAFLQQQQAGYLRHDSRGGTPTGAAPATTASPIAQNTHPNTPAAQPTAQPQQLSAYQRILQALSGGQ